VLRGAAPGAGAVDRAARSERRRTCCTAARWLLAAGLLLLTAREQAERASLVLQLRWRERRGGETREREAFVAWSGGSSGEAGVLLLGADLAAALGLYVDAARNLPTPDDRSPPPPPPPAAHEHEHEHEHELDLESESRGMLGLLSSVLAAPLYALKGLSGFGIERSGLTLLDDDDSNSGIEGALYDVTVTPIAKSSVPVASFVCVHPLTSDDWEILVRAIGAARCLE